ncbi:hypothetical protein ACFL08_03435 [Patescibacteria group bacterium]
MSKVLIFDEKDRMSGFGTIGWSGDPSITSISCKWGVCRFNSRTKKALKPTKEKARFSRLDYDRHENLQEGVRVVRVISERFGRIGRGYVHGFKNSIIVIRCLNGFGDIEFDSKIREGFMPVLGRCWFEYVDDKKLVCPDCGSDQVDSNYCGNCGCKLTSVE